FPTRRSSDLSAEVANSSSTSSSVTWSPYVCSKISSINNFCKTVSPTVIPLCKGSSFIASYNSASRIRPASVEATSGSFEQPANNRSDAAHVENNNFFILFLHVLLTKTYSLNTRINTCVIYHTTYP